MNDPDFARLLDTVRESTDAYLARLRDPDTRLAALAQLAQAMERTAVKRLHADLDEWNAQCQ